jgi:hypothetical protein
MEVVLLAREVAHELRGAEGLDGKEYGAHEAPRAD